MYSLVRKYWKVSSATIIMMAVGFGIALAFTTTGSQVLTGANIISSVNDGSLVRTATACNFNNPSGGYPTTHLTSRQTFVACIVNNGSCTGPDTRMMTWSDALACRTITSSINAITDTWMVNSSTSWSVFSSANFGANGASAITGAPSNAQAVSGTGFIQQQLSPSSIASGTAIVIRAYVKITENSYYDGDSTCGTGATTIADGSATIQIVRANGTVLATTTGSVAGYTQLSVSATTPATDGYYARLNVTTITNSFTRNFSDINGTCSTSSGSVSGSGYITGVSAGNL